MVKADIAHFDALVENEQFALDEVDAVIVTAGKEVGGAFAA